MYFVYSLKGKIIGGGANEKRFERNDWWKMGYNGTRGTIGHANYKKNCATLKLCICKVVSSYQTLAFSKKKLFNKSFGTEILQLGKVWN